MSIASASARELSAVISAMALLQALTNSFPYQKKIEELKVMINKSTVT